LRETFKTDLESKKVNYLPSNSSGAMILVSPGACEKHKKNKKRCPLDCPDRLSSSTSEIVEKAIFRKVASETPNEKPPPKK